LTTDPLPDVLGPVAESWELGGGDICRALRVRTDRGVFFAKTPQRPDPHMFEVEAAGLRLLGDAVPGLAPRVVHVDAQWLVLEWVDTTAPTGPAAEALGRRLAALHANTGSTFGAGPEHGRIGSLPMPAGHYDSWPAMYARLRLAPLLDEGLPATRRLVDVLTTEPEWAGPAEPPSLLHGDLWSGNLLWASQPMLIDPAVHTGHRETDLAMLALFGAPHLQRILAAYDEAFPLADGWRDRVALHQLWPLLVHHRLFGAGYGARAEAICEAYLQR
jgi:fructosamine-3-kinase